MDEDLSMSNLMIQHRHGHDIFELANPKLKQPQPKFLSEELTTNLHRRVLNLSSIDSTFGSCNQITVRSNQENKEKKWEWAEKGRDPHVLPLLATSEEKISGPLSWASLIGAARDLSREGRGTVRWLRARRDRRGRPWWEEHCRILSRDTSNSRGPENLGKKVNAVILKDWMLNFFNWSRSSDIYRRWWSYTSRKHIPNAFCKFSMSKHMSRNRVGLTNLEMVEKNGPDLAD